MADRPLTPRQVTALLIADGYGITRSISGSLPSLERRGLAEKYWETTNGRRWRNWRVTEAGHAEAERLRAEARVAA